MIAHLWLVDRDTPPSGGVLSFPAVFLGAWCMMFPNLGYGQWVLTAMHPDPTPPLGAPEAEYVAVKAMDTGDTCVNSEGWALEWNGSSRPFIAGCWPVGTTLVAHRGADSTAFDLGNAVPMGMATWPALVNSGGSVVLRNASGEVVDAMPYSSEALGGGGRPVMRSDPEHCGAAVNQHLWEPGANPFWDPQPTEGIEHEGSLLSAFEQAQAQERLVPRGVGRLDWFFGMAVDPVARWTAAATVGGHPASLQWLADSVVQLHWSNRPEGAEPPTEVGIPISMGPLRGCFRREEQVELTTVFWPIRSSGNVAVVGALADPVSTDPTMNVESIALMSRSDHPVGIGSWSFGGGHLRRQIVLQKDSLVWLNSGDFEDWPGMPNAGGSLTITLPQGGIAGGLAWDPCDHDAPGLSGSGLPLVRSDSPGSAWHTAGGLHSHASEPIAIKGAGCRWSPWEGQDRIEVFLNRYLDQLGPTVWKIEGDPGPVSAEAVPGHPEGASLGWEGMRNGMDSGGGVTVILEHEGEAVSQVKVRCPEAPPLGDGPCLRIVEMLWNAKADGDEFAEVENCGTVPVDLSGLQATTETLPLPSNWLTWVSSDVSMVLAPGEVAAFGRCPKWMGFGLPESGPARWSAEQWGPLNDAGGVLKVRLPSASTEILDEVQWGPELKGPWWWTEDGWAWERSGTGSADWSPAPGRGSPGAPQPQPLPKGCGQVALQYPDEAGGLPAVEWALPMAGGTMVIDMVEWPSGGLLGRTVLSDLLPVGRWSWRGGVEHSRTPSPGVLLWDVKWWSGLCKGRRRFVINVPGHG